MLLSAIALLAQAPNRLRIDVRYPRFRAGGAVARAANAEATARERIEASGFRARYRQDLPELRRDGNARDYEMRTTPHRITDRAGLASGYVETYGYLAGAHGTTSYDAINVGVVRGQVRAFGLKDLFRPGEDAVGQCSRALVNLMKATKEVPSRVADGSWTRLSPQDHFVVGNIGVLFLFDQYEVGYGAQGAPKVLVPYAKLPGLDRKGVLAAVMP